jgi:uncharacterized protein YehS (DUF1456 family)
MNGNDVLIRLRYALNITDLKVIELFGLAGREVGRAEIEPWFTKEGEPGYAECPDEILDLFLSGLITSRRGRKEDDGASPRQPRTRLSNNDILKALRIALELRDEDIADIMRLSGMELSKAEISALFRKPRQPNYRPCGDQVLRNFLAGLTSKYRV